MSTDNPGCGEGEHQRDQLSFRNRERQLYLEHRIGVRLIELELAQSAVRCLAYDKTPSRTRGTSVNVLGDEILADAGLPRDEDLPVARRRARRGGTDLPHRRTRAHDDRVLTSWSDSQENWQRCVFHALASASLTTAGLKACTRERPVGRRPFALIAQLAVITNLQNDRQVQAPKYLTVPGSYAVRAGRSTRLGRL